MSTQENVQDLSEFDQLSADIALFVSPIKGLKVTDAASLAAARDAGARIKLMQKTIEAKRVEMVKPLNHRVDVINAYAKTVKRPLDEAEAHVKHALTNYEFELERKRQAEAQAAEAKRRQEEVERAERARLEREAIEARQAEERRKAEEEERQREAARQAAAKAQAEATALFGADEDEAAKQREREAAAQAERDRVAAETKAREEQAERERLALEARQRREADEAAKAAEDERKRIEADRVKGARKVWKYEIVDPALVPREYLMVDEKKIAQAIRGEVREIAGVRIYQETQVALSTRGLALAARD